MTSLTQKFSTQFFGARAIEETFISQHLDQRLGSFACLVHLQITQMS